MLNFSIKTEVPQNHGCDLKNHSWQRKGWRICLSSCSKKPVVWTSHFMGYSRIHILTIRWIHIFKTTWATSMKSFKQTLNWILSFGEVSSFGVKNRTYCSARPGWMPAAIFLSLWHAENGPRDPIVHEDSQKIPKELFPTYKI